MFHFTFTHCSFVLSRRARVLRAFSFVISLSEICSSTGVDEVARAVFPFRMLLLIRVLISTWYSTVTYLRITTIETGRSLPSENCETIRNIWMDFGAAGKDPMQLDWMKTTIDKWHGILSEQLTGASRPQNPLRSVAITIEFLIFGSINEMNSKMRRRKRNWYTNVLMSLLHAKM